LLVIGAQDSRRAIQKAMCGRNALMIQGALLDYEAAHGDFPPSYITDANGKPLQSWRVLILPYLGEKELYSQIRLEEPWNSPHNLSLANRIPEYYRCPADTTSLGTTTNYTAVVGPLAAWHGMKAASIPMEHGYRHTIMVVEVANSGIHWMEPRDLTFDEACAGVNTGIKPGISSCHPAGVECGFADGTIHFVPNNISPQTLREFLTVLDHKNTLESRP
jgi:hypothetical protein